MTTAATLLKDCLQSTQQLKEGVGLDAQQNYKSNKNNDVLEEMKPTVVTKYFKLLFFK